MTSLLLAIFFNLWMSMTLKVFEGRKDYSRQGALVFNYGLASLLSFVQTKGYLWIPGNEGLGVLFLGILNGLLFLLSLYLMQVSTYKNDAPLTATFNRLGVLIPSLFSIIFLGERPLAIQYLGLGLAFLSMGFLVYIKSQRSSSYYILLLLMASSGCIDLVNKAFSMYSQGNFQAQYVFYIFFSAFIAALWFNKLQGSPLKLKDFFYGSAIGLPNLANNILMVQAVTILPGYLVFPTYSQGIILSIYCLNYVIYKIPIAKKELGAIALLTIGLILLNYSS